MKLYKENTEIKKLISNILAISFISLIFIFVLTWIIFDFEKSPNSLKDTWAIVSSIFGGVSTLVAAYIACYLYVDWRNPHNSNIETEHKKEILKIARKIAPLEQKYNNLISNHFIYHDQPNRTIPIEINQEELKEFISNINELLSLMEELVFISGDQKIKFLNNHYLHYAQLYPYILNKSEEFFKTGDLAGLVEFLRSRLEFEYTDINGKKWDSYTLYAYVFKGLQQSKLQQYLSENLKSPIN